MRWPSKFCLIFPLLGFLLFPSVDREPIRFFQMSTIPFDWDSLQCDTLYFQDSLSGLEVFQIKSLEGIPLFFGQDISTDVCFDNKCRPLHATVYWNITGRYLGFMLAEDDFLSRRDHDPFKMEDYEQLHSLLADPFLPFAGISFEELIQPMVMEGEGVDGISSATSKNISSFVVEGAAYTTYTLWNIIHGPIQNMISGLTDSELTQSLLTLILKSSSSEDKIWALKKINNVKHLDPKVEEQILQIIEGGDFFVTHTAINELQPHHLGSETLQDGLIARYQKINPNLRKPIFQKLQEAPVISPLVVIKTRDLLIQLNGMQLGSVLDLYDRHKVYDLETIHLVAKLLKSQNAFIARTAYQFLVNLADRDQIVDRAIGVYETGK